LKSVDFYGEADAKIAKLAFRRLQSERLPGPLCFPSLLSRCGQFRTDSPFDLWICGRCEIERWMTETGKTIVEFPCIKAVAQRHTLPSHVRTLLSFPELLPQCVDTNGQIQLFEFRAGETESAVTIPIPQAPESTLVFWFAVHEMLGEAQTIYLLSRLHITAARGALLVNQSVVSDLALNRWYNVAIKIANRKMATFSVNLRKVGSVQCVRSNKATFGGRVNQCGWYLGGTIRFFEALLSDRQLSKLFARGMTETSRVYSGQTVLVSAVSFLDQSGNIER
jgi:hypothetical protein